MVNISFIILFFHFWFRYQLFLQVKQDILQGRLPISFELAAELGAYIVQCKYGVLDLNNDKTTRKYQNDVQLWMRTYKSTLESQSHIVWAFCLCAFGIYKEKATNNDSHCSKTRCNSIAYRSLSASFCLILTFRFVDSRLIWVFAYQKRNIFSQGVVLYWK